ncbi:MAG: hypothetical protein KGO96_07290 [Elusimicrobia bacterium]|nr:hypothetical protein [Elusimicrobiota bacterium]
MIIIFGNWLTEELNKSTLLGRVHPPDRRVPPEIIYGKLDTPSKPLTNKELITALMMLGSDSGVDENLLLAGKFMSCNQDPDDSKIREARLLYEGDPEKQVLAIFGLEISEKNIESLDAIKDIVNQGGIIYKSEQEEINVEAAHYNSKEAAGVVKKAIESGHYYKLALGGKYSDNSAIIKDPKTGMLWLVKPGTQKLSPAAGVREERATQSQREAAFYEVAKTLGMGSIVPRTFLIKLNGKLTAVMPFLPHDFKQLDKIRKIDPNRMVQTLEKYRRVGEVHKFAVIDWILGQTDRHGGNILISDDNSLALIDHGGAFAGKAFNPAFDDSSFIPFYLRYTHPKGFKKLSPRDRFMNMPTIDIHTDKRLKDWILDIKPYQIEKILKEFDINPEPELNRLKDIQDHAKLSDKISDYLNKIWSGYVD